MPSSNRAFRARSNALRGTKSTDPASAELLVESISRLVSRHLVLFVTMAATMMHALTTKAVDIVLAGLLLFGSVTGAQLGSRIAQLAKPEVLDAVAAYWNAEAAAPVEMPASAAPTDRTITRCAVLFIKHSSRSLAPFRISGADHITA